MGRAVRKLADGAHGFAAVDALVALTILASTLALGLEALISTRRVAFSASETRQAQVLLEHLVARETRSGLSEAGSLAGVNWRTSTSYLPADPGAWGLSLCRRLAQATSARSGRRYTLATAGFCRPAKGAS